MAQEMKSELQKKLEAEGWELFTIVPATEVGYIVQETETRDQEIRQRYMSDGNYKDVRVTNACDIFGNLIPGCRAVYVKYVKKII